MPQCKEIVVIEINYLLGYNLENGKECCSPMRTHFKMENLQTSPLKKSSYVLVI